MIQFNYETDFKLEDEQKIQEWISSCIVNYGFTEGELNYIFCDDDYLFNLRGYNTPLPSQSSNNRLSPNFSSTRSALSLCCFFQCRNFAAFFGFR